MSKKHMHSKSQHNAFSKETGYFTGRALGIITTTANCHSRLLASFGGGGGGGGGVDLELFEDDRDLDPPDRTPRCGDRDFRSGFVDAFSGDGDKDAFLFAGDLDLLELDLDLDLE